MCKGKYEDVVNNIVHCVKMHQGRCAISYFTRSILFLGEQSSTSRDFMVLILRVCVCPQFKLRILLPIIMNGNLLSDIFAVCDPAA